MKYVFLVIYNINYRNVSFGITLYICVCEIVHVNISSVNTVFFIWVQSWLIEQEWTSLDTFPQRNSLSACVPTVKETSPLLVLPLTLRNVWEWEETVLVSLIGDRQPWPKKMNQGIYCIQSIILEPF